MDGGVNKIVGGVEEETPEHSHAGACDPAKPFTLNTDASDYAVGALLEQVRERGGKLVDCPVGFWSRKLTKGFGVAQGCPLIHPPLIPNPLPPVRSCLGGVSVLPVVALPPTPSTWNDPRP